MAQTDRPIMTPLGELQGCRDVFVNYVSFDPTDGRLEVKADVDGSGLTSAPDPKRSYPFLIVFKGVLAFRVVELDSWDARYSQSSEGSNLDEIVQSYWMADLAAGGKVRPDHHHYSLQTYDHVLDVICKEFTFDITADS